MRGAALLLAAAALALPARAQTPPAATPAPRPPPSAASDDDVIGSLLDPRHKATAAEEEEPDTAGQKAGALEPELSLTPAPGGRAVAIPFAAQPRPETERPVGVDETGRTPDGPASVRDLAYDARIRSSFAAAQGFQGPLDGGWTLTDARSGDRFKFQIVDRRDRLEAVWRDLRAMDAATSGLVDDIQRGGGSLTLSFTDGRGAPVRLSLRQQGDDRWSGQLTRGDERLDVTMRRTSP